MTLGQSGVRLCLGSTTVYVDPYLSDSVAEQFGPALRRRTPVPFAPGDVTDADWVLITHEHLDHADPQTLAPLAKASRNARFLCSCAAAPILASAGIEAERVAIAGDVWVSIADGVRLRAVPAAHLRLDRDESGRPLRVGFLIEADNHHIYHAGDTIPHPEIVQEVRRSSPLAVAFLPVNERNYFRDAMGIVGNMTVREAYQFADLIRAESVVPIHWDLFEPNATSIDEMELLYRLLSPRFKLRLCPVGVELALW